MKKAAMNVAMLTTSISRRAGGVMESVRRLSQSLLHQSAVGVRVFGLRDEYTDVDQALWNPLCPEVFPVQGPSAFGYASLLQKELRAAKPDLVHTQGIWMFPSLACTRWALKTGKPHLVTPHGMLDPWALKQSRWKKRAAAFLFENAHLKRASCLHALTESEAQSFREYGLTQPICIIPNGVDVPKRMSGGRPPWEGKFQSGRKVILYLGRIHPKKGLTNLLSAWKGLQEHSEREHWGLAIAGWDQGGYEAELKKFVTEHGLGDSVVFLGPQFGEDKARCFENAAAFVLPSFSEGLPMVVLEAWAYRLPVIMTPQCNLPVGFQRNAAIRVDCNERSVAEGLWTLFQMKDGDLGEMGANGNELVSEKYSWASIAEELYGVYKWVLGGGARPNCVATN